MGDDIDTAADDPRARRFGYVCNRCRKCCYDKGIQLNPYEVARLARNRGMSTSEFRAAWTKDGAGLHLGQREDGACVFLGSEGCSVHADRPLVCRLYPLGRVVTWDGTERFRDSETHPESHGVFTESGTIAEFLDAQGAHPFMKAADDYYFWLCAAAEHMEAGGEGEAAEGEATKVSATDETAAWDLLDMDLALARHCAEHGLAEPADIEARRQLHLEILYQQIGQTTGGCLEPA